MDNQAIIQAVEAAPDKKILVADLLAMSENGGDDVVAALDELTHLNTLRVIKDKELQRFVVRPSGKAEFDLSEKPGATKEQREAFYEAAFTFEHAFVVNFSNMKRFEFNVVKLAKKNFADVYTTDGRQAGFIKYMTSTKHPWYQDFNENHWVLGFTTIGMGKQIIDKESQLSYWLNKDFYNDAFAKLRKEHQFQMKSMQGLVKMVINKMYPEVKNEQGKKIRRKSLRVRVSSLGLATYNGKDINQEIEIGGTKCCLVKTLPGENETTSTLYLMVGEGDDAKVVATAYFRPFHGSGNFFESNVVINQENIGQMVPSNIIEVVTGVMEKESRPNLSNAFASL